jgi:hypothetical protein
MWGQVLNVELLLTPQKLEYRVLVIDRHLRIQGSQLSLSLRPTLWQMHVTLITLLDGHIAIRRIRRGEQANIGVAPGFQRHQHRLQTLAQR